MKKIFKFIGKFLLGFIIFVLLYLLASYIIPKFTIDKEVNSKEEIEIFILTNGVHTDIVVPRRNKEIDWTKEIKYSNTKLKDSTYQYLAMGWGDKGFYLETPTWAELKPSVAFKAAFGLNTTAIHATYYKTMPENESCKRIMISSKQYKRLVKYIKNTFKTDDNNRVINIDTTENYGDMDAFYEAQGSYSFIKTCNYWANNALKESGQKCCYWTPFDKGIFDKYK